MGYVEDAGGGVGFGFAIGCGASRAGLALGEIEDAGAPASGVHGEESAAAGLFYVVAVRGDCQDVDRGKREERRRWHCYSLAIREFSIRSTSMERLPDAWRRAGVP